MVPNLRLRPEPVLNARAPPEALVQGREAVEKGSVIARISMKEDRIAGLLLQPL
jgi:hypothetical protein